MKTAMKICLGMLILCLAISCIQKPPPDTAVEVKVVGNSVCPVSGKDVGGSAANPTFYSDFKGYRIGFMCPVCKGKFDDADDAGKLALLNTALKSVNKPKIN